MWVCACLCACCITVWVWVHARVCVICFHSVLLARDRALILIFWYSSYDAVQLKKYTDDIWISSRLTVALAQLVALLNDCLSSHLASAHMTWPLVNAPKPIPTFIIYTFGPFSLDFLFPPDSPFCPPPPSCWRVSWLICCRHPCSLIRRFRLARERMLSFLFYRCIPCSVIHTHPASSNPSFCIHSCRLVLVLLHTG